MQESELEEGAALAEQIPSRALKQKAQSLSDEPLPSGRTVIEAIELLEELAECVQGARKSGALFGLPHHISKGIVDQLTNIHNSQNEIAAGAQPIQHLDNQLNALHQHLWLSGLLHWGKGLPSLESKNRTLNNIKRKGRRIIKELEKGLPKADEAQKKQSEATKLLKSISEMQDRATKAGAEAESRAEETQAAHSQVSRLLEETRGLRNEARERSDEASALKEKVQLFFEQIQNNEEKLNGVIAKAESSVEENSAATRNLVSRNQELQDEIDRQLEKATGASLFHAFHEREKVIWKARWTWAILALLTLGFSVLWGHVLAKSAAAPDAAFWVKLGTTVPLLVAVFFCITQYGRERRAEEEYAFKSALSLSLVPYKDLIENLDKEEIDKEYAEFLVRTIGEIYTRPAVTKELGTRGKGNLSLTAIEKLVDLFERMLNLKS